MNKQENEPYQRWPNASPVFEHKFFSAGVDKGCRRFILVSIIVLASFSLVSAQKKDSCVECHTRLGGMLAEPVQQFNDNIHKMRVLSCNDCHGGDPTQDDRREAKDPLKGYVGKPKPHEIRTF